MKANDFGSKKIKLAEIIENRQARQATEKDSPSKFAFVYLDGTLSCIWTKCITPPEMAAKVHDFHVREAGFTLEEWDELTETLYKYL